MTVKQFEPKFMKISVLTAALQELTPREIRDKDPDRAIEEWLQFAREVLRQTKEEAMQPRENQKNYRSSDGARSYRNNNGNGH